MEFIKTTPNPNEEPWFVNTIGGFINQTIGMGDHLSEQHLPQLLGGLTMLEELPTQLVPDGAIGELHAIVKLIEEGFILKRK